MTPNIKYWNASNLGVGIPSLHQEKPMTELSFSANLTWQLAAQEAAAARSEFIEPQHILMGICSLEKISMQADELDLSVLLLSTKRMFHG